MEKREKITIPVILVKSDAESGEFLLEAGTSDVSLKERTREIRNALGLVFVHRIKCRENRKVDQKVLSTEIGVLG